MIEYKKRHSLLCYHSNPITFNSLMISQNDITFIRSLKFEFYVTGIIQVNPVL